MADYQLILKSSSNVRLAEIEQFSLLDYVLSENDIGICNLVISTKYDEFLFSGNDIIIDTRLEIWRAIGAGGFYLDNDAQWLLVDGYRTLDSNGSYATKLIFVHANDLLKRHIVAYNSGSAQADKSATFADNSMKAVVRENLGSLATDTTRDLSTYLAVQVDNSLGASVAKAFSRRNVLEVLQEYALSSLENGTYLAFDTVYNGSKLEFRTYANQRGIDRRYPSGADPIIISPEYQTLGDASLGYLHRDEINYVYAGGQGTGSSRDIQTASDSTRISQGPLNRRELFVDARTVALGDLASLLSEAEYAVRNGVPRRIFSGKVVETPQSIYGLHYGFGDYLTASYLGSLIDAHLIKIRVKVQISNTVTETIEALLKSES